MLGSEFQQAIGRAVTDAQFCARLVADPADALTDYGLGAHEAYCLQHLHSVSLADLITQLVTIGAQLWGIEFCALLRELHSCLPTKQFIHIAGLLPIPNGDELGQSPDPLWPDGIAGLN